MVTTFLFVPAHDAHKVAKAQGTSADAVILDLEDGVPDDMKDAARDAAVRIVRDHAGKGPQLWVRVNGTQTRHHEPDMRAIDWTRAGLLFPKAEDATLVRALARTSLSALVLTLESAAGFAAVRELVAASPVAPRLAIGTWDLALDLGLPVDDPDQSELIWHLRAETVLISRALRLQAPVDGVYGRLDEAAGFEAMAARAHRLGFGGKLLIHPAQIPLAARIFGIDQAELRNAHELIAAYEQAERSGTGAIRHRGQMIDRVHVEKARALIARSGA